MPYWDYNIDLNVTKSSNNSINEFISQIVCLLNKPYLKFLKLINQLYEQMDNLKFLQFEKSNNSKSNDTDFNINNIIKQLFMIVSMNIGINSSNFEALTSQIYCEKFHEWLQWNSNVNKCVVKLSPQTNHICLIKNDEKFFNINKQNLINKSQNFFHNVEILTAALSTIQQVENIFNNSIIELINETNSIKLQNTTDNLNESIKDQIYFITDENIKQNLKNNQSMPFNEIENQKHKIKIKKIKTKPNLTSTSFPLISVKKKNKKNNNYKINKHKYFKNDYNKEINKFNTKKLENKNYNNQLKYGESIFDARFNFPKSKYNYENSKNNIEYFIQKENDKNLVKDKKMFIAEKKPKIIYNDEKEFIHPNNNLDLLLKYLKRPKLPKGTILWREKKPPIPLVYFTVTIIKGPLSRKGKPPPPNKRRARGARIYLSGLNMPTGYTQITEVILFCNFV